MVVLIVRVSIDPEQRDRWLEVIRKDATESRTQPGCEKYHVSEDLEAANNFLVVEQWASKEAHYDHFRQPQFRELSGVLPELLAGPPEVSIYDVATTRTLDEALAAAGIGGEV